MAGKRKRSGRTRAPLHVNPDLDGVVRPDAISLAAAADGCRKDVLRQAQRDRTAMAVLIASLARQCGWNAGWLPAADGYVARNPDWIAVVWVETFASAEVTSDDPRKRGRALTRGLLGWNVHRDDLDLIAGLPRFEGSIQGRLKRDHIADVAAALLGAAPMPEPSEAARRSMNRTPKAGSVEPWRAELARQIATQARMEPDVIAAIPDDGEEWSDAW